MFEIHEIKKKIVKSRVGEAKIELSSLSLTALQPARFSMVAALKYKPVYLTQTFRNKSFPLLDN